MLIFLIFRAEAYTCWSARCARSRAGGVARLFREISFFFRILVASNHAKNVVLGHFIKFRFFTIFFSIIESLAASENEQATSYHAKNVILGHFIKFPFFTIY